MSSESCRAASGFRISGLKLRVQDPGCFLFAETIAHSSPEGRVRLPSWNMGLKTVYGLAVEWHVILLEWLLAQKV